MEAILSNRNNNTYIVVSNPELESGSSGRVGFGSGSGSKLISSNFVHNFFKFNDLILCFEWLYLH